MVRIDIQPFSHF